MDQGRLPVYRASLPRAERLLPYLQRIDANRWYSNRGELVKELEVRLGILLGGRASRITTAASGTAAIEGAILATTGRARAAKPLALLPAYTFVATAMAAEACGYTPYLVDVDPQTWALDPIILAGHPALERTGVVVPVAPFGRGVAQSGWLAFRDRTRIPVVIDGAAALESLVAEPDNCIGAIPVALSFQATKAFSCSEGGAIVWDDPDGLERVMRSLNFGMYGRRESTTAGTNGKMSEYHAAVGLAALDAWEETRHRNDAVAGAYRQSAERHGFGERLRVAPAIASNYSLLDAGSPPVAQRVATALAERGIETRWWYGRGLHHETYYRAVQRDPLPTTDRLAPTILGLPISPDFALADIERTVLTIAHTLTEAGMLS